MTETAPATAAGGQVPEVPLSPRWPVMFGLACIVLCLGGFFAWATLAPIAGAVVAPSVVKVDSNRKEVQHLEGGIVKDILVRDGDRVQVGDVLIRLDETRAGATLAILQGAYDAARAVEARLAAERDGAAAIGFPDDLVARSGEAKVAEILDGQGRLFEARRSSMAGQIAILEQRIAQLGEEIGGLETQERAMSRQLKLIKAEHADLKALFKKGHTTRPRMLALERESARLEGERGQRLAEVARAKKAIGETKLEIIQLQREFQQQAMTELRETQDETFDLAERINAAQLTVDQIDIRAPTGGVVVNMAVHTVGGVVRAGETLMEIVPGQDRLTIESRIEPVDIDNTAVGQEADVRLTAFKQRSTPILVGRVAYVSADSLVDERSGQSYYQARIEVPDSEIARLGDQQLQPGMPAEVMIKTGERTALQYLIQPITDSFRRAWRED